MERDGELVDAGPGSTVSIKPGHRHGGSLNQQAR